MNVARSIKNYMANTRVIEGIFAIEKPASITSFDVVRGLQKVFKPSRLFAPWLEAEQAIRDREHLNQKQRRKFKKLNVKIGHGGTLDPLATGVLVIGVGKGTKELPNFLSCTKSYETTVLFGAATDTYDRIGRILSKAPYAHITRQKVEDALEKFRGNIMQTPPIYSALSMNGKRLYEYAREGKELPREIPTRPVRVDQLEIMEWLEPGTHKHTWPTEEAQNEEKKLAQVFLQTEAKGTQTEEDHREVHPTTAQDDSQPYRISLRSAGVKRKRSSADDDDLVLDTRPYAKRQESDAEHMMSGGLQSPIQDDAEPPPQLAPQPLEAPAPDDTDPGPPAVKLRMTVTSGFYVRSLCHDLGKAVGSLGLMSELVRTRQGDFELGKNVLAHADLEKGEKVWGPALEGMLSEWQRQEDLEKQGPLDNWEQDSPRRWRSPSV